MMTGLGVKSLAIGLQDPATSVDRMMTGLGVKSLALGLRGPAPSRR